jgi:hypothetical protein
VTQHKHAALSHWTPAGWVINLGAGFQFSWWDKDDYPRSGTDFLLESQARENTQGYLKVLRAQWISRVLGEEQYNDRKNVAGGFWSNIAHYQATILAANAVAQGPLGEDLAEADEDASKQFATQAPPESVEPQQPHVRDGSIVIPSSAMGKNSGPKAVMKSFSGGMQIHAGGGFKSQYAFDAPAAGTYNLSAKVATLQEGQVFFYSVNGAAQPVETPVPYTVGLWQQSKPVQVQLVKGANNLNFEIKAGSRGVTIKEFTLTPAGSSPVIKTASK